MNAPITNIRKDVFGKWNAETKIALNDSRQLKLRTSKNDRGTLVTYASVCVLKREPGYVVETFEVYGDYMKTVYATEPKRVTAKTVEEQQAKALQDLPYILENVKAYYAAKGIAVEVAA